MDGPKVAVIGAGMTGFATPKNLREEGFEVERFKSELFIGGVWSSTVEEDETSTLKLMISNKSKHENYFADFPFPSDTPDFTSGEQIQQYLEDYAQNFDIRKYIQINTGATKVVHNDEDTKWLVHLLQNGQDKKAVQFDKVVVCVGARVHHKLLRFEGQDLFEGKIIYSHGFKKPAEFSGKRAFVVRLESTAANTLETLEDLRKNSSIHLPSIHEFIGSNEAVLEDGSMIEVDVVICYMAYSWGFELIPELQLECNAQQEWISNLDPDGRYLPSFYQSIFPQTRGESIAFLNNFTLTRGCFLIADLAAIAITQTWKGSHLLSQEGVNEAIAARREWMTNLAQKGTMTTNF